MCELPEPALLKHRRLLDNLEGLKWIVGELTGRPISKPTPTRTPSGNSAAG